MQERIYILSLQNAEALGAVRCLPGLQVAVHNDAIWLRGIHAPDVALQQLPVQQTLAAGADGLLFQPNALTPVATLPTLNWQPLPAFLSLQAPVAAMPGAMPAPVFIQLVPAAKAATGYALLTTLALWQQYAETAPAVRLQPLQFAVSDKAEVLITGQPLPPLPGTEYWMWQGMLLPNGYDFEIPLAAHFISQKINPDSKALILFDTAGRWQAIDKNNFVPATRSAIRQTVVSV
jgi:hypothetical protein